MIRNKKRNRNHNAPGTKLREVQTNENVQVIEEDCDPQTPEEYFQWKKSNENYSLPAGYFDCPFTDQLNSKELDELAADYRIWRRNQGQFCHNTSRVFIAREKNQLRYWSEFAKDEDPTNMPVISLQKAEKLVKPTGPFQTTDLSVRGNRVKVMYWGDSVEQSHLDLIISNAWKYRVLFFDTEEGLNTKTPVLPNKFYSKWYQQNSNPGPLCGSNHVPEPLPKFGEFRPPRLTTIIGDFEGNVYIFREIDKLPQTVKTILAEFRITKLQSNVLHDIDQLERAGIKVRGFADTQLIYRAFVNQEGSKQGTEAQAKFLNFENYPYWDATKRGDERSCHFDYPHLTMQEILHATEDVRIPAAILLKAAIIQAQATKMPEQDNIYPLVMEAIDLVKSIDPWQHFEHLNQIQVNWRPETRKCPEIQDHPKPSVLNKICHVQKMRRARADFIEPAFEEHNQPTQEELTKVVKTFWIKRNLPPRNASDRNNMGTGYFKICRNCGSDKHWIRYCDQQIIPCNYPHSKEMPPHSILTCEELSQFCTKCNMRGHFKQAHSFQTVRQLENNFLRNCHKGIFVCYPYLELVEEKEKLLNYHWLFSLHKTAMPSAAPIARRLSLPIANRLPHFSPNDNRSQYKEAQRKTHLLREKLTRNFDSDTASNHESDNE